MTEIPGWCDFEDIYAEAVETARDGDVLVEVGSWMGASAVVMARLIQESGKRLRFVCVDRWEPWGHPKLDQVFEQTDVFAEFKRNLEVMRALDVVEIIRAPSLEAAELFTEGECHFVFIDDDHSLDAVRAGIRAWLPKVKTGGILAGHDYDRRDTVRRAVLERFGARVETRAPRSWRVRVHEPSLLNVRVAGYASLCLALNVRDEQHVIERCIESAAPYIDGVVCADTGSTDDTIAVIKATCEREGLKLTLHERPWQNFADSFTQLLREAEAAGYAYGWVLDADEEVLVGLDERERFKHMQREPQHGYSVCRLHAEDWEIWSTRVFRLAQPWRYEGARHAAPKLDGEHTLGRWPLAVANHRDGMHGTQAAEDQRARFRRDVVHFLDKVVNHRLDTRSWYYLAQSARDAGQRELALWAYRRRADMGGFAEERYLAALQVARWTKDPADWEAAIGLRPQRHEAHREYAQQLFEQGKIEQALAALNAAPTEPSGDRFLVRRSEYQWRFEALRLEVMIALLRSRGGNPIGLLCGFAELAEQWDHPDLWAQFERVRDGRC